MKLILVLLAVSYASGAAIEGYEAVEEKGYEPIGYDQPAFDRYSYGYGNPTKNNVGGLIEVPVPYVVGRQGIGFDKRTAFAYGFRMPLTLELLEVLRRYPEAEKIVKV